MPMFSMICLNWKIQFESNFYKTNLDQFLKSDHIQKAFEFSIFCHPKADQPKIRSKEHQKNIKIIKWNLERINLNKNHSKNSYCQIVSSDRFTQFEYKKTICHKTQHQLFKNHFTMETFSYRESWCVANRLFVTISTDAHDFS